MYSIKHLQKTHIKTIIKQTLFPMYPLGVTAITVMSSNGDKTFPKTESASTYYI